MENPYKLTNKRNYVSQLHYREIFGRGDIRYDPRANIPTANTPPPPPRKRQRLSLIHI